MINLDRELHSMINLVEKMVNEKSQKIDRLEAQRAKFWNNVAGPSILNLNNAINKLEDRSGYLEPHRSDEPIRILRVKNENLGVEWEFSFRIKTTREDLNLWVELGEGGKKYSIEEIDEDKIYKEFIEQYKTKLLRNYMIDYRDE